MGSRLKMRGDLGGVVGVAVAGVWAAATWAGPVDAPVQARGRVVRVETSGMGIEFEKLDGSARDAIDRLVRELRNRQTSD